MKKKNHIYESDAIEITYDLSRCIHARECVNGLSRVFDPEKRPWIQPDNAAAGEIASVIHSCPSGALHYTYKDTRPGEPVPDRNTITVVKDGPLYVRGNIELQNSEGEVLLKETRIALCRCGASKNKPFCDNHHKEVKFSAPASFEQDTLTYSDDQISDDKIILILRPNGSIRVRGEYELIAANQHSGQTNKSIPLCRCGGSQRKPFCDGTHKHNGFKAS